MSEAQKTEGDAVDVNLTEVPNSGMSGSASGDSSPRSITATDLPVGTVIDGKYRIDSILGQGGMGIVVAATHLQLREKVALKFLKLEKDADAGFRSRFRREAQIAAKIRNEHITRVIDVGVWNDAEYMVMEHLAGNDLRKEMRTLRQLPFELVVEYAHQLCDGLAEVHARGVVHRDLKPSNLFVVQRSDGSTLLKILDFGISKWAQDIDLNEDELTKTGAVLGSPKYMAPEQLFGSSSVDARADVWSVGAMLYEMVTGKPPFDEPTFARLCVQVSSGAAPAMPHERRPDVPAALEAAIMLCLERDPAKRLPNVAVVAGEILAAAGNPNAEQERVRLESVLAAGIPSISGSTPSMRSGEYVAQSLLRTSGSHPAMRVKLSDPPVPQTDVTAQQYTPPPATSEKKNQRGAVVVLLALVAAAVLFFMFGRGDRTPPPAAASSGEPTGVAPTASLATTATSAVPTAADTTPPSATAAVVATATTTTAAKPNTGGGGKKPVATAKAAEPTPTPTPTPAATPAPTPTPTPKTAKPNNPLEDRQ